MGWGCPVSEVFWRDYALCVASDVDPEWFFQEEHGEKVIAGICSRCPVMVECRRWTLAVDARRPLSEIWGTCGGLTRTDRQRVRRQEMFDSSAGGPPVERLEELRFCAGDCGRLLVEHWEGDIDPAVFARHRSGGKCRRCVSREYRRKKREGAAVVVTGDALVARHTEGGEDE